MNRRAFLKLGAGYALLRAIDYTIGENEQLPNIEPFKNDFVDLLAFMRSQSRMVFLGDTGHNNPELKVFLSSRDVLVRLGQCGFDHHIIEQPVSHQKAISDIQNKKINKLSIFDTYSESSWLTGSMNRRIQDSYIQASYGLPRPLIHAVDTRDGDIQLPIYTNILMNFGYLLHILLVPLSTTAAAWTFPLIPDISRSNEAQSTYMSLLDDTKTANRIHEIMSTSRNSGGLVVYGAGHFCGFAESLGVSSMCECLVQNGYSPLRVDLFVSDKQLQNVRRRAIEYLGEKYRSADVDFILQGDQPAKIVFHNKRLESKFAQYKMRNESRPHREMKKHLASPHPV